MCKTNRAKEYLERIAMLDAIIEGVMYEKKQWQDTEERIYGTTTSYGESTFIDGELHNMEKTQSSGLSDPTASMAIESVKIASRYDKRIAILQDQKEEIIKTMEEALDVEEFKFMHKVYVQGLTLGEAAGTFNKSYSWATSIHGRALKRLENVLIEREKKWKQEKIVSDGTQQETAAGC